MPVALGIVATIGGAALAVPVWIALGVLMMVFGAAIAYVVARRPSHRPQMPDRPDS